LDLAEIGGVEAAREQDGLPMVGPKSAKTPDITLVELRDKLKGRGVSVGIGTLWRFFDRRRITFKKRRRMPRSSNAVT
jgi:transposase